MQIKDGNNKDFLEHLPRDNRLSNNTSCRFEVHHASKDIIGDKDGNLPTSAPFKLPEDLELSCIRSYGLFFMVNFHQVIKCVQNEHRKRGILMREFQAQNRNTTNRNRSMCHRFLGSLYPCVGFEVRIQTKPNMKHNS